MFKDRNHIQELIQIADNFEETKRLTHKFQLLKRVRGQFYLTFDELEEIFHWKLRKQVSRQKVKRNYNTNENIILITKAAFGVTHVNKDFETRLKLSLLCTLTGVEVPVASAILTLCFPDQYSVIDFRNWRQIYGSEERKTSYTLNEYTSYLNIIINMAKVYQVTPQEIDIAIWQLDIDKTKNTGD